MMPYNNTCQCNCSQVLSYDYGVLFLSHPYIMWGYVILAVIFAIAIVYALITCPPGICRP